MRSLIVGLVMVGLMAFTAQADPEVENNIPNMFDKTKSLVDSMEPRVGAFWNVEANEWQALTGAKLLTKDVKGYSMDLIAGYGANKTVLAALETDILAGFSKLTGSELKAPWLQFNVGFGGGYSWDSNNLAYGPTLDATVTW